MSRHGTFTGNPRAEWLIDAQGDDRDMKLLDDFAFTDPQARVWPAPKGAIINGASIPNALWALVGSPYTGDYRRASVVHDVACGTPGVSRKEADVMFYHACRAGGCGAYQARVLYAGVRIGAWASRSLPERTLVEEGVLFRKHLDFPALEDDFMRGKLTEISREMEKLPDEPSIEQLDAIIEHHVHVSVF